MGEYTDATGKRRYVSGKVQNELALKSRQGGASGSYPSILRTFTVRSEPNWTRNMPPSKCTVGCPRSSTKTSRSAKPSKNGRMKPPIKYTLALEPSEVRGATNLMQEISPTRTLWRVRWVRPMPAESTESFGTSYKIHIAFFVAFIYILTVVF